MKENNKHTDYNALLQKYASGNITKEERFALEKRALDDPFVAEALEGIHDAGGIDIAQSISNIDKEINQQIAPKLASNIFTLRFVASIAATVLIVSLIGYTIMDSNGGSQEMAQNSGLSKSAETATSNSPVLADAAEIEMDSEEQVDNAGILEEEVTKKEELAKDEAGKMDDDDFVVREVADVKTVPEVIASIPEEVEMEQVVYGDAPNPPEANEADKRDANQEAGDLVGADRNEAVQEEIQIPVLDNSNAEATKKEQVVRQKSKSKKQEAITSIAGTVLSMDAFPLVGASVMIKSTGAGIMTDDAGKFVLDVDDLPTEIVVNAFGYGSETRIVSDAKSLTIVMQQHNVLNEVVLTNAGKTTTDDLGASQSSGVVLREEPVSGLFVLEEFIKDNKWQSVEEKKTMEGWVIVGFTISPEGETKNLRIVSSSCTKCHDRAKWLIENSGLWKNASASDIQATYQVTF